MKKLSLILAAVVMLAALTGCAAPAAQPTAAPVAQPTAAPAQPTAAPVAQPTEVKAAPTEAPKAPEPTATAEPVQPTATAEVKAAAPKVLTYQYHAEPISLDTSKTNDNMSAEILYHLSEGLVRFYDGQVIPGIAETWDVSADGVTYTFQLRDAVWQDGQPVTAEQFRYSFVRLLDAKTAATFPDVLYPVVNAEQFNKGEVDASEVGIKAVDDKTLQITLKRPMGFFITTLATNAYFYPLRQDFVEQHGDSYAADETSFLSNGPFILKEWKHEASLDLVKNPDYWNADKVKLDEIVQLIVPDPNTIVAMYDRGELDYIPNLNADYLEQYPDAKKSAGGSLQFLEFNLKGMTPESGAVLSNRNFRLALSYALDRTAINGAIAAGSGTITGRLIQNIIPGTSKPFVEEYPISSDMLVPANGDPVKAKAYLDAALEELGTTVDKLPTITYVAMESPVHKLYAEGFVDAWSQVLGINSVKIQILPIPQALQAGATHQYDIFLLGMGGDPDPYPFLAYWTIGNDINWTGWEDQTYTDLVQKSDALLDPKARLDGLAEAEKYLVANGPLESLWEPGLFYVSHDYVSGIVRSSLGAASQLIYADVNK